MPKRILGWEQHKELIHKLWIVENRPLHDVMRTMERDHGFKASKRTYENQFKVWGFPRKTKFHHKDGNLVWLIQKYCEAGLNQREIVVALRQNGYDLDKMQLRNIRLHEDVRLLLRQRRSRQQIEGKDSENKDAELIRINQSEDEEMQSQPDDDGDK
ncbi:Clr5 domain-containing protein [Pyronema omphalodes]|nr:Clr5 domain-containing protein [Pyronema omphalodes]